MRSVRDISVEGKRVFVRVDYNLPMDDQGRIADDNRIRQTLDLIQYLGKKQAKIILASHLAGPKGDMKNGSVWRRWQSICPVFWEKKWPLYPIALERRWQMRRRL